MRSAPPPRPPLPLPCAAPAPPPAPSPPPRPPLPLHRASPAPAPAALALPAGPAEAACALCQRAPREPVRADCGHRFCRACVVRFWAEEDGPFPCPECADDCWQRAVEPGRPPLSRRLLALEEAAAAPAGTRDGPASEAALQLLCRADGAPLCAACRMAAGPEPPEWEPRWRKALRGKVSTRACALAVSGAGAGRGTGCAPSALGLLAGACPLPRLPFWNLLCCGSALGWPWYLSAYGVWLQFRLEESQGQTQGQGFGARTVTGHYGPYGNKPEHPSQALLSVFSGLVCAPTGVTSSL